MHIRQGDYVSNPATNHVHGTCSLEYYQQAVRLIAEKVSRPHFFVFSDEQKWAKKNLRLDYPVTYVTHNLVGREFGDTGTLQHHG